MGTTGTSSPDSHVRVKPRGILWKMTCGAPKQMDVFLTLRSVENYGRHILSSFVLRSFWDATQASICAIAWKRCRAVALRSRRSAMEAPSRCRAIAMRGTRRNYVRPFATCFSVQMRMQTRSWPWRVALAQWFFCNCRLCKVALPVGFATRGFSHNVCRFGYPFFLSPSDDDAMLEIPNPTPSVHTTRRTRPYDTRRVLISRSFS